VKSVFGVALLAAAGILLAGAFPAAKQVFSAARAAAMVAAAAAAAGVLAGALHASFGGPALERAAKAVGIALLVGGIVYGAGASAARERSSSGEGLAWLGDEAAALALAKKEGRPVIIDFWADWCTACKELDRTVWANPRIRSAASRFVAVKVDATEDSAEVAAVLEKYGVVGMPSVIFIDAKGHEVPVRITGAIGADEMLGWMKAADQACVKPLVACVTRW
jgi:thiol:disulfide interchange protein DsbD